MRLRPLLALTAAAFAAVCVLAAEPAHAAHPDRVVGWCESQLYGYGDCLDSGDGSVGPLIRDLWTPDIRVAARLASG